MSDNELLLLIPILESLAKVLENVLNIKVDDVRVFLRQIVKENRVLFTKAA
jgi:hypothetical protein